MSALLSGATNPVQTSDKRARTLSSSNGVTAGSLMRGEGLSDTSRDRAEITGVLIRYATGIDRRDWELFRTCWTEDTDADYGRKIGHFHGADEITAHMVTAHADMGPTWHRLSNFVIEVDGDSATARTYVHAVLMVNKNHPDRWLDVVSHYDDILARTATGWKISSRRVGKARVLDSGPSPTQGTGDRLQE